MRYKEFHPNKVLEDSISLFWDKGYGPTAINDIVEKTGVNRFSLYEEFDNKKGILMESLQLYKKRYGNPRIDELRKNDAAGICIEAFFKEYIQDDINHPPGCFIIHIATELADTDEDVKGLLEQYLNEIESALIALLCRENYEKQEAKNLGRHILGLFCTSMCFCVIQSKEERNFFVQNGLNVIFNKHQKAWQEV